MGQREIVIVEHPFAGSALCTVDASGRLRLPGFVRDTLKRRSAQERLLVGSHETDPCLIGYDRPFAAAIHADNERRRLAEEAVAPHRHHVRARRSFGFVEDVAVRGGVTTLPPMMRRRARIGDLALVIGAGGTFEIWDAQAARGSADADLRELATFHLDSQQAA